LVADVARYPVWKGGRARAVGAGSRVLVPDLGQLLPLEPRRESDQRRPQPLVDIRDLSIDQLANQYLVALTDCLRDTKDLVTLRVAPPTTANRAACDRLGKTRHGSSGSLQHDPVSLDECQSFLRT